MQPSIVSASCFEPSRQVSGSPEITHVVYDLHRLRVSLAFPGRDRPVHVVFRESRGFRVLDEGDLTEFWNPDTRPDGWLWRINSGGWLDLERSRATFLTGLGNECTEYLVLGVNDCVSVVASEDPTVEF